MTYKVHCYKTYLGDGAYAELSDVEVGGVWITTSNGIEDTNAVYLEPQVLAEFLEFVRLIPEMERKRAVARDDYDPTPWCTGCGSKTRAGCKCGPLAENE